MAVEYGTRPALLSDICDAYLRPLYDHDGDEHTNIDVDYTGCNEDMASNLLSNLECLIFFVKNSDETAEHTHYLCYFYSNEDSSFEASPDSGKCGVLGYITKTSEDKYTFTNTNDISLNIVYDDQNTDDGNGNVVDYYDNFTFTITDNDDTFSVDLKYKYDIEDMTVKSIESVTNQASLTLLDPTVAFNNAILNQSYFYDVYGTENEITRTVVCNDTLYEMKPTVGTFSKLFKSIGTNIPLSNIVDADSFSVIIVIQGIQSYHPVYITIDRKTSVDSDDDGIVDVFELHGTMTTYGCPLSQEVNLNYNLIDNTIKFTPINGALSTNYYFYEIYALFIDPPKTMVASTVMNLLYPVKTLATGTSYMYMQASSKRMRDIDARYGQMNYLYTVASNVETITSEGTGRGVWSDSITGDGKGPNDCNVVYRFFDTLSYSYIASGSTITTSTILEGNLTETIEGTEYTDVNIRYNTNEYGLLPSDSSSITDLTDRTYLTPATSDLLFNGETAANRYRDLSYFKGIKTGTGGGISVKDGDSGYLCTMALRDIFVSRCYDTQQKIPADASNSITKPVIFGGNTVYKEGYTLTSYTSGYQPTGSDPGTANTLTSSSDFTAVITKASYDTIIYVEIVLRNVDADTTDGSVYFDTAAGTTEVGGVYTRNRFYGYLIIDGTDGIKVTFYYNDLSKSLTLTLDSTADNFKASHTNGFAIELTNSVIRVTNYQELLPANMMFDSTNLPSGELKPVNELSGISTPASYNIMAVYTPNNVDPPVTEEITSSICLYSNKIYLEEGEYDLTDYSDGLLAAIDATNKTQLELTDDLDWLAYDRLYVAYTVTESTNTFKNRLFVICYHINKTTKKVTQLTFHKFSNKQNAVLEECQKVIVNMTPIVKYTTDTVTDDAAFPTGEVINSSSCTFDITMGYDSSDGYSITYSNMWYNYLPKTTSGTVNAAIASIIGVTDS